MKNLNRFKFLQITICLGFLVGLYFSRELWFPVSRTFPRVPFLFESPVWMDRLLTIGLIASLISLIFFQKRKILPVFALGSLFLLIFFDQTRLQPWVYQYLLILLVLFLRDSPASDDTASSPTIGFLQIIMAGLYLWSGIQKMNHTFFYETVNFLLGPLEDIFPSIRPSFVWMGLGMAVAESLIAIGLIFRRSRNISVMAAIAMHLIILSLLIARNYNSIVWIWNVTLIPAVFIVFWRSEVSFPVIIGKITGSRKITTAKILVILYLLLPILSFWGWWDLYLSGVLYSGTTPIGTIVIHQEWAQEKLSPVAQKALYLPRNGGMPMLPLNGWAMAEMNVPAPPERRFFVQIARDVCRLNQDQTGIELIIKERPAIFDGKYQITRLSCSELEP